MLALKATGITLLSAIASATGLLAGITLQSAFDEWPFVSVVLMGIACLATISTLEKGQTIQSRLHIAFAIGLFPFLTTPIPFSPVTLGMAAAGALALLAIFDGYHAVVGR